MEPGPLGWEMDPGMGFARVREVGRTVLRPIPGGSVKAPSPHLSWGLGVLWPPTLWSRATCGPREKQQGEEPRGLGWPGLSLVSCVASGGHRWLSVCTGADWCSAPLCLLPKFRGVRPLPSSWVRGPTAREERSSASRVIGDSRFMKRVSLRTLRDSRGREQRAASINPGLSGRTQGRGPPEGASETPEAAGLVVHSQHRIDRTGGSGSVNGLPAS